MYFPIFTLTAMLFLSSCGSESSNSSQLNNSSSSEEITSETNSEITSGLSRVSPSSINKDYWGEWQEVGTRTTKRLYITSKTELENMIIHENDIVEIDNQFFIRTGVNNVNLEGKVYGETNLKTTSSIRSTKATGFVNMANIEIYLQNMEDQAINVTTETDENGTFSNNTLPAGDYYLEGTDDGKIVLEANVTLSFKDEDLGQFKIVGSENSNFRVVLGQDTENIYANGEIYETTLRVRNIGTKPGYGLNYDIEVLGANSFEVENNIGTILPGAFTDIKISMSFSQQYENVKEYPITIKINDANGNQWYEEVVLNVYKGYFTFNFQAQSSLSGVLIYPNGKSEEFNVQNKTDLNLPLIRENESYAFVLTNYGDLNAEAIYGIGIDTSVNILAFSDFKDTSAFEPNNALNTAEILEEKSQITSYLHFNDIDYWKIITEEDSSKNMEELNNLEPNARLSKSWNDENLTLSAETSTDDEGVVKYIFTSSVDGLLYQGNLNSVSSNELSETSHEINLTVVDKWGETDTTSQIIDIFKRNTPPIAKLKSNLNSIKEGETVTFDMSDSSDNVGIEKYILTSDLDGEIYNGTNSNFSTTDLSAGNHTISLKAIDEKGLENSEKVSVQILVIGEKPVAVLSLCDSENVDYAFQELSPNIEICITGSNSRSVVSTISKYVFESSIDGVLSENLDSSVSKKLSAGNHEITLFVTSKNGLSSEIVSMNLIVKTSSPTAMISTQKEAYGKNENVYISGEDSIDPDGDISTYTFTSSIDGELYSGENNFVNKILSFGKHKITLVVEDSTGETDSLSKEIEIKNLKPTANLYVSKTEFKKDEEIILNGSSSFDSDGEIKKYIFTSSLNGTLYTGERSSFTATSLKAGEHEITLTVEDDNGEKNSTETKFTILNELPSATLDIDGRSFSQHAKVQIDGSASSDSDGEIVKYIFKSNQDGIIYNGSQSIVEISTLSPAEHIIELEVVDDSGASAYSSNYRRITIIENGKPIPVLEIEDKEYLLDDVVYLNGLSSSDEDGIDDIVSYTFTSSRDGELYSGTTNYFHARNLSIGDHEISLTVTDKLGLSFSDIKNLTITNKDPEASLEISGTEYYAGEIVYMSAKRSSDEDGEIKNYTFSSSLDGVLSTNSDKFSTTNLSVGTHTITLSIEDYNGGITTKTASLTILQNLAPVTVLEIENSSYKNSEIVLMSGANSVDSEGSIVNYKFSSSLDGILYTGVNNSFPKKGFSVGVHTMKLETTDNLGLTSESTKIITIENSLPTAIISPFEESYLSGEEISFSGASSSDIDNSIEKYKWVSSIDGEIGGGKSSFYYSALSIGTHTITLTVTDENGGINSTSSTIKIVQNNAPVSLLKITDSSDIETANFTKGETIKFDFSGSSDLEDTVASKFVLTSSLDDEVYNGTSSNFTKSNLSVGTHVLTLTVSDRLGVTNSTSKTIQISNKLPTAVLTIAKESYTTEESVIIDSRSSTDPDGNIAEFIIKSSLDGEIGTTSYFSLNDLSIGTHVIQLTVVDDDDGENTVSNTIEIKSLKPVAMLNSEYSSYLTGTTISFEFNGSMDSDGEITNYKLLSSIDGEIFSGLLAEDKIGIEENSLSEGIHKITLTVTDDDSEQAEDEIELTIKDVNEKPIADLSINQVDRTVTIFGHNSTDPDGFITRYRYKSNIDGIFHEDTDGKSFDYSNFSTGEHIIILEVEDDTGEINTIFKTLTIE
ncbi:hypothetical protein ThvES_00007840 [Thiovulum sp. ES]|nr:hypothetical protein ThvES_00007840 [Thiovulum sp. ES]